MVIQCSSCDTRFKLADDKIKPGGVKVRCSKCKEVFTVHPPEDETADTGGLDFSADGDTASGGGTDWSDLNGDTGDSADNSGDTDNDGGFGWSMGSDESSDTAGEDSFSFGDDSGSSDELSFDDSPGDDIGISFDDDSSSDNISFDDAADDSGGISFDDDSGSTDDDFGFDEPVGEGAQDEFSFDDGGSDDSAPDFDWDGSDSAAGASDDFDFGDSDDSGGGLDFSSVALEDQEETPAPEPEPMPEPAPMSDGDAEKPLSAKGPQKAPARKKGRKQKKQKRKSSGAVKGLLFFILFILLLVGAHLGLLYWKKLWSGDPNELMNLDHEKVHIQLYVDLYNELTGGQVQREPTGQITVLNMAGRFVENSKAGTIFVIEGEVTNEFQQPRSAIAVRGILYNENGQAKMRRKAYCGNRLSESELQSLPMEKIKERLDNQFGDSLSNLDIAPGVKLRYTIVFDNLPDNLAEYNVEVAESAPGSK